MKLPPNIMPILCILAAAALLATIRPVGELDAVAIWSGVQVYLRGGDPYNFQSLSSMLLEHFNSSRTSERFANPPWAIPLLVPLFWWSFKTSKFLLIVGNLATLTWCITRLQRMWGPIPWTHTIPLWLYFPSVASLYCGQLSFLPLVGILLAIEWISSPKAPWWKWCVAMTCLFIKPQGTYLAIIFLIVAFLRKATGAEITKVLCVGGGFLVLFCPRPLSYMSSWTNTVDFLHTLKIFSLSTGLRDLMEGFGFTSKLSPWILPLGIITGSFMMKIHVKTPLGLMIAVLISCATAPYIWVYDYSALLPLCFFSIASLSLRTMSTLQKALGVGLSALLVMPVYIELLPSSYAPFFIHLCVVAALTYLAYPMMRSVSHVTE